MSRAKAVQQSKDRLVANMLVAIPTAVVMFVIWKYQRPKASEAVASIDGWSTP
jgi:hypothetical protein